MHTCAQVRYEIEPPSDSQSCLKPYEGVYPILISLVKARKSSAKTFTLTLVVMGGVLSCLSLMF